MHCAWPNVLLDFGLTLQNANAVRLIVKHVMVHHSINVFHAIQTSIWTSIAVFTAVAQ